jgi:hypothetical protein
VTTTLTGLDGTARRYHREASDQPDLEALLTRRVVEALKILDAVDKLPDAGHPSHGVACWHDHKDCLAAHVAGILRGTGGRP